MNVLRRIFRRRRESHHDQPTHVEELGHARQETATRESRLRDLELELQLDNLGRTTESQHESRRD